MGITRESEGKTSMAGQWFRSPERAVQDEVAVENTADLVGDGLFHVAARDEQV